MSIIIKVTGEEKDNFSLSYSGFHKISIRAQSEFNFKQPMKILLIF